MIDEASLKIRFQNLLIIIETKSWDSNILF